MYGYVLLRYPLKKIRTCLKFFMQILNNEWGKNLLLYLKHRLDNSTISPPSRTKSCKFGFGILIIILENYSPHHKLRKCIHWKPANQKFKASRFLGQLGLRRLQTCWSDMSSIIVIFFNLKASFVIVKQKLFSLS